MCNKLKLSNVQKSVLFQMKITDIKQDLLIYNVYIFPLSCTFFGFEIVHVDSLCCFLQYGISNMKDNSIFNNWKN